MKNPSRAWYWIAGAVVGLTLLGCSGAGDTETAAADEPAGVEATAAKQEKKADKPEKKTPGLNDAVRDGKFEFTVTKVKCGVNKVGSDLIGEKAQGQFCLIDVQVKNIGKEAQAFADSAQKAFDAKKVEYSVDSAAALYANEDQQVLFEEINPGNTVKGKLVFDIPDGTKLTSLELHDSVFSGGVTVSLR
ncbi:DUF4352 domain-containing protein [Actinoplanes sp. NPDC049802]|uniref:DUF4352 domain-containing protein n=1 Tax=Actinoplanes sp. NPDC049802 TaxID=3154742 RepID=UPI00340C72C4